MRGIRIAALLGMLSLLALAGCGGGSTTQNILPSTQPQVVVSLAPSSPNIRLGDTQQFTATVTGSSNSTVTWQVNGTTGGSTATGTISTAGLYTPPATLPANNVISVTAVSVVDATKSASTSATLLNPIPVVSAVVPPSVDPGSFTAYVTGTKFVSGAQATMTGVTLTTTFVNSTLLRIAGSTTQAQVGTSLSLTVTNPNPGSAASAAATVPVNVINARVAARFLEQASFGPTPSLIAHVAQIGLQPWLNEQFALPVTALPDPPDGRIANTLQNEWMLNALNAPDQLRQRMAFALEQTVVISAVTITNAQGYAGFLRTIQQDAFGNFATLMNDFTLSPAMGRYLDMVNNDKPNPVTGTHANENYAREILQLFTIGLVALNPDGTVRLDANGNAIPTYDQSTVIEFARAFTGFTYPNQPGHTLAAPGHNGEYYVGNMIPWEPNHDTDPKTLLNGTVLPAGQTATADLNGALQNIFNHPNVGPFICKQLIQHLVTSNPSPAYVNRVVQAFNNNSAGVRGDLKAVVTTILLDQEARAGDFGGVPAIASAGHLSEPVLYMTRLLRNLNATVSAADPTTIPSTVVNLGTNMNQRILYSPTVFNYFPPDWQIQVAGTTLLGPEFQIQNTATMSNRANFVNSLAVPANTANLAPTFAPFTGVTVDYSPYASLATDVPAMLDAFDLVMMHGQMSAAMRQSVTTAVQAVPAANGAGSQRARTAVYLLGTSSQYQVVH